ncbi:DHA2 family efflux MFS transporter permease subunit [Mycetocola lacteus]|uniref:DHA2 family efflux MFS transporter permease subunit n=1 Tax=Mycetocola lacteus TaxID=76637 RepID=A0A3L7AVC7_9MICO|nr:DHA2 family efflux MFS transporter permease subunit [Mycetocola lacteus]RLP83945.1 DHA2 family efflux MFS transporter permease subunit [Mycetocola lacteus]
MPHEITPLRRLLAMIALLLCQLTATIDASIVNVALPALSRSLHAGPSETVWVTTAFLLAVACMVPMTSALGDQIGQRTLFLAGAPLFTLASLACALSPSLGWLIFFRVVQGIGSAMIIAAVIPMFRYLYPPQRIGSVMGINAMVVAIGTAAGPTLGGLILAGLDWPWLFLINVPIGIISIVLGALFLPKTRAQRGNFDARGSVLIALAIAAFLLGVNQLVDLGTIWVPGILLAIGAAFTLWFIRHERVAIRPIIPPRIWNGVFSIAVLTAWTSFFAQGIAFVALPFLFQSEFGATPLQSALLFTPWPAVIILVAPISGRLADRIRPAVLALVGLGIYTVGLLMLAIAGPHPSILPILIATAICGLGFGTFQSPNNRDMLSSAPLELSSSASAVLNTNRTIGQSAGSGAVSMAFALFGAEAASLAKQADAAAGVLWIAVFAALASVILSALKVRRRTPSDLIR